MKLDLHGLLGPILGGLGGALITGIFGNAQNKSNQAAQQNAQAGAQQFDAAQLQKMIDFIKSQQQSAFGNLSSYLGKNPMPTANLPPIALPNQIDMPSIGGQTIGTNGAVMGSPAPSPYTNPNANSQLLNMILPGLLAQIAPPTPPTAPAPAPPTPPQRGPIFGGGPRRFPVQSPFGGGPVPL